MYSVELNHLAPLARDELARRRLEDFLALMVPSYNSARHTESCCVLLEALERREVRRALIFMPPRHGKTLHVSQTFPAWYLGRRPSEQVILASYAAELAEANSRRARGFVMDPRYPFDVAISSESSAVGRWHTSAGGGLIAAGVGGGVTGFGADLLIIDDPVKDRAEADSERVRNAVWAWFTEVAMTRLMPDAVVLLTMTRWHEDDLAGQILNTPGASDWTILRLPALAEKDDPLDRAEDEALWPSSFPREALPSVERGEIDSRAFAALYQQRPTPDKGGIIKRAWLEARYETLPRGMHVIQSVDAAFKTGVASDYSVIATWGTDNRSYFLIDVWRRRVEYPDLVRAICNEAADHNPRVVLIEDAASGQSAIQDLRHNTRLPIIPITPKGTKASRLATVSGLFESGRVLLPENATWLDEWIEEHVAFPTGRYDDQVDCTSLALERLRSQAGPRVRALIAPPRPRWPGGISL